MPPVEADEATCPLAECVFQSFRDLSQNSAATVMLAVATGFATKCDQMIANLPKTTLGVSKIVHPIWSEFESELFRCAHQ
jgi:hypothetical protein